MLLAGKSWLLIFFPSSGRVDPFQTQQLKVGNKGGLVVTLHFGPVSLCFVSCHLAAHMPQA